MSLFVGNLAFVNNLEYMDGVKIGVAGSLLSFLDIFYYYFQPKNVDKEIIKLASYTSNVGLKNKYSHKISLKNTTCGDKIT